MCVLWCNAAVQGMQHYSALLQCLCPWLQGMVLVDAALQPRATWEFDADIAILTHSTTIAPKYQAVIHCEIVRQAARVVAMDRERLRSGDRAPPCPASPTLHAAEMKSQLAMAGYVFI